MDILRPPRRVYLHREALRRRMLSIPCRHLRPLTRRRPGPSWQLQRSLSSVAPIHFFRAGAPQLQREGWQFHPFDLFARLVSRSAPVDSTVVRSRLSTRPLSAPALPPPTAAL